MKYYNDLLNQIKILIYKTKSAFGVGTLDFEVLTTLLETKSDLQKAIQFCQNKKIKC